MIAKAINRIADQAPIDPVSGTYPLAEERQADALYELASRRLASDPDADRATVVVHADAPALIGGDGVAALESGSPVAHAVLQRLLCDGRLQTVLHSADGTPIGMGRTARTVSTPLARQVRRRDGSCRFPGCHRTWTEAHHHVSWLDGGHTDYENLYLLCPIHHRLVHEHGWKVTGDPNRRLTFHRPDGKALPERPPPLRAEIRQRFFSPVDGEPPAAGFDDSS